MARATLLDIQARWVVGDLLPIITVTINDANGNAVDLTGMTAKFYMIEDGQTTAKIAYGTMTVLNQTTNKGQCTYSWTGTDTDTPGTFMCRVRLGATSFEHTDPFFIAIVGASQHPLRSQ